MITRFFIAISFVLLFNCQNTSADHSKKHEDSRKIPAQKPSKLQKNEDKAKKDNSKVYNGMEVDTRPEYPGGIQKFNAFIKKNYIIPEEVIKEEVSTGIFATFIIENDGRVTDVKILRDFGYGTGKELERVLKLSPHWIPAKKDGKPVRCLYSIPYYVQHASGSKGKSNVIMTNTQISFYVDIFAGIGTFISSIIALFALKEVIKQRRAMYQPKLYFNEFSLSVKGNPHSEKESLYQYYLYNLYEPVREDSRKGYSVLAQFFFENIGYGVANNINYEWTFDYLKAARILCELDPKFNYEDNKKRKSLMIVFDNNYFSSYGYDDIGKARKIDFIKPESLQQNFKPVSIPKVITDIHMDYVLEKNKMFSEKCKRFNHEEFDNFPIPKLSISYYDIAGKKYVEEYLFNISCYNSYRQMDDKLINTQEDYANLCFYLK